MAEAHRRKKNPEVVRAQLIESAIRRAQEQGLNAVGVEAVSKASGVTRGALFHHFHNKQALVDAVFQQMLEQFDQDLQNRMSRDPEPYGRFTRAYLELAIADDTDPNVQALWLSTIADPALQVVWTQWFKAQLERLGDDEQGVDLEIVRFAADGLWLGLLVQIRPSERQAFLARLLPFTRPRAQ